MKKFRFLLLSIFSLLLVSCGSPNIEYTKDRIIPSFNNALKDLKLNDYVFTDKDVKISTFKNVTTVTASNDYIQIKLVVDDKQKIEGFEFLARGDIDIKDVAKIRDVIKNTFKNKDLYQVEEGVGFGAYFTSFIFKK